MSEGWRSVPVVERWARAGDVAELHDLIGDSVDRTLARVGRNHPPDHVACCVSGGLDSSTIASFLPGDVFCVTGWYDHPGCDERDYARLAVGDRPWLEVKITPEDFVYAASEIRDRRILAGLRCGPGAVGQWVVAHQVRSALRQPATLLTGEGGDELFGGYARQMIAVGYPCPDGYDGYELPEGYPKKLRQVLDVEWNALRSLCAVDEAIAGDFGFNVATPLLDPWVVAWVFQQPPDLRIGKGMLREAMQGRLPAEILNRTDKAGFPVPFVHWAQEDPVRGFLEDTIGYVPDRARPYDRQWWYDFLDDGF